MRAIFNLVSVCFFLLLGGQHLYANADKGLNPVSHSLEKKHKIRVTSQDGGSSIIEDADIDEECRAGDDLQDPSNGKISLANQNFLENWYLRFSSPFIFKNSTERNTIIASSFSYSNPIYIRLGVLRI